MANGFNLHGATAFGDERMGSAEPAACAGAATSIGYTLAVPHPRPSVLPAIVCGRVSACQGVPAALSAVVAEAKPKGAVMTWKAPADVSARPVSGCRVIAHAGWEFTVATTSGETTAAVTGLENGKSYTFTVAGSRSRG